MHFSFGNLVLLWLGCVSACLGISVKHLAEALHDRRTVAKSSIYPDANLVQISAQKEVSCAFLRSLVLLLFLLDGLLSYIQGQWFVYLDLLGVLVLGVSILMEIRTRRYLLAHIDPLKVLPK